MDVRSCWVGETDIFEFDGCIFFLGKLFEAGRGVNQRRRPAEMDDVVGCRMCFRSICSEIVSNAVL